MVLWGFAQAFTGLSLILKNMITKARPINVNMLPQDPFFETLPGRVLTWASSVGRYLVIFTELVVIISFATRFKLDRDLTDLNDRINQKAALVQSYGDLEERVRTIQKKTQYLNDQQGRMSSSEALQIVSSSAPQDVILDSLQFRNGTVGFSGNVLTSSSLAQYILALQANPKVRTVSVSQVKSAQNGLTGFEFGMDLVVDDAEPARQSAAPTPEEPTL